MRVLVLLGTIFAMSVAEGRVAHAVDSEIKGFSFECELSTGAVLKPRFGDIDGFFATGLPEDSQACRDMIDRKRYLCRRNTDFRPRGRNEENFVCLPVFESLAQECETHFESQRLLCGSVTAAWEVERFERVMELTTHSNVRSGPGTRHDVIMSLEAGINVEVTGRVRDRNWLRVAVADGGEAFIYAPLLQEVSPSGEPGAVWEIEPHESVMVVAEETAARSGPSTDHELIMMLDAGTEVAVTGEDRDLEWLRVALADGDEAFIHVPRRDEPSIAPGSVIEGAAWEVEPYERVMVVAEETAARSGPSTGHELIMMLDAGIEVAVTGEVRDLEWLRVALADGDEAFIHIPRREEPSTAQATVIKEDATDPLVQTTTGEVSVADWSVTENQVCAVWNYGDPDTYEPLTWSGTCVDGKTSGEGRLTTGRGDVYTGGMEGGRLHGEGSVTYNDGERYEGVWHRGRRHGEGVFTWSTGERYEGAWREGRRDGEGTFTWATGERYEGAWQEDRRNGEGVFIWADGRRYEGTWRDDRPHGQGIVIAADGRTYQGEWHDGCFEDSQDRWAVVGASAADCGFE